MKTLTLITLFFVSSQLTAQVYYADYPPRYYDDKSNTFYKQHEIKICRMHEFLTRDSTQLYDFYEKEFNVHGNCIRYQQIQDGNAVNRYWKFQDTTLLEEFTIKTGSNLRQHDHHYFDQAGHEILNADTLWVTNLFMSVTIDQYVYSNDTLLSWYRKKQVADSLLWEQTFIYELQDSTYLEIDHIKNDTVHYSMKSLFPLYKCDHSEEMAEYAKSIHYPVYKTDSIQIGESAYIVNEFIQQTKNSDWKQTWQMQFKDDLLIRAVHFGYALFNYEFEFFEE